MNETNTLKRIAVRLKKLVILIVLIPILTAVAAYFLSRHLPTTYTASEEITLGNFQDEMITNIGALPKLLTNPNVLKQMDKKHVLNVNKLLNQLKITTDTSSKSITFSIKGPSKQKARKTLSQFINVYKSESNGVYLAQVNDLKQNITKLNQEHVSGLAAVVRDKLLYERNQDLTKLRNSKFFPISVKSSHTDPKKRAILGFLIGIMLDVAILLIPEIFRSSGKETVMKN